MAQIATCHHCGRLWLNTHGARFSSSYGLCFGGRVSPECQQAHVVAKPMGNNDNLSSPMYITCVAPPKFRVKFGDVTLLADPEYRARMHALAKIFHANSKE